MIAVGRWYAAGLIGDRFDLFGKDTTGEINHENIKTFANEHLDYLITGCLYSYWLCPYSGKEGKRVQRAIAQRLGEFFVGQGWIPAGAVK
jgi:hypothetical protein